MQLETIVFPIIRQVVSKPRLADALFRWDRWGNQLGEERYSWPYPGYEKMRADGPVAWRRLYNSWFVTGYDEARTILASPNARVSSQLDLQLTVSPYRSLSDRSKEILRLFLLFVDPPDHTRLRSLVGRAFTPRQVARMEPAVTALVAELLDNAEGEPEPDLFAALARPLPVQVISELIGVPRERWAWMQEMSDEIAKLLNPFVGFDPAAVDSAIGEFEGYFLELAADRRRNPTEDLITALAQVEEDGDRLTETELVSMVAFLLFAGHETTTGLIGNSLVALARHPEQRRRLIDEPSLWDTAVEELIRWDTAVHTDLRSMSVDTNVGDVTIKAGDGITIMLGAVNRDPRVFTEPNTLRLDRDEGPSLSFGHGIHYCVGAALARMELRAAVRAVLNKFGQYTIDEASTSWKNSFMTRGPICLPVRRDQDLEHPVTVNDSTGQDRAQDHVVG